MSSIRSRFASITALLLLAASCSNDDGSGGTTSDVALDAGPSFDTIGGGDTPDATTDTAPADVAEQDAAPDAAPDATPDAAPDVAPDVVAPDVGEPDVPAEPPDITILTFNTARFFDDVCDSDRCGDGDFERMFSAGQLRYKAQLVAQGIAQADPDIVLLQEVESQLSVDALMAQLAITPGGAWPTARIGETGFAGSLDVVVLSRYPTVEVRTHRSVPLDRPGGGTTTFAREFLEVHFEVDGTRVIVFCAHFKSQNDDDPTRRLAEARGAHDIILERTAEFPDALIVLGGDLNDEPGSEPIDAIEAGGQLIRVAAELGQGDDTHSFSGRQPIDHIFWASNAGGSYRTGSATVLRDGTGGFVESDHAALRAAFDLP